MGTLNISTKILSNISTAFATQALNNKLRDSEFDQIFIERGFTTVRYQLEFLERYFGAEKQKNEANLLSDSAIIKKMAESSRILRQRLADLERNSAEGTITEDHWADIRARNDLLSSEKLDICQRWFPRIYHQLTMNELPFLKEAKYEEIHNICRLYLPPCQALSGSASTQRELVAARKNTYNKIITEVFSVLGFTEFKMKSGLLVLRKYIANDFFMTVETDALSMERKSITILQYAPDSEGNPVAVEQDNILTLDNFTYLAFFEDEKIQKLVSFSNPGYAHATYLTRKYKDTCTLEVALRARALWYELTVLPFEKKVIEILSNSA